MAVVKNLQVDHCATWQPRFGSHAKKSNGEIFSLGTSFDRFSNISSLSVNFRLLSARGRTIDVDFFGIKKTSMFLAWDSMLLAFYVTYSLLTKFPKLNKLSILLKNNNYPSIFNWSPERWIRARQNSVVDAFENSTLEVITAALGVMPKLCDVTPCSAGSRTPDGFRTMYFQGAGEPSFPCDGSQGRDVEWFWAAGEGKTLVRDMEKANEKAKVFGLKISEDNEPPKSW